MDALSIDASAVKIEYMKNSSRVDRRKLPPIVKGYLTMGAKFGHHYCFLPDFQDVCIFLYVKRDTISRYLK